jgi:hypothetical protein
VVRLLAEMVDVSYLKALLESSAFLKSGGGLSKAISIPSDLCVVIPFIVHLSVAFEVFIEGELYIDGELFVE